MSIILLQLAYVVLRTRIRLFSGEELHIKLDTIRTHDVLSAIERTKPSAKLLKDKYSRWQREYESVWCLCSWHTLLLTWCVCACEFRNVFDWCGCLCDIDPHISASSFYASSRLEFGHILKSGFGHTLKSGFGHIWKSEFGHILKSEFGHILNSEFGHILGVWVWGHILKSEFGHLLNSDFGHMLGVWVWGHILKFEFGHIFGV